MEDVIILHNAKWHVVDKVIDTIEKGAMDGVTEGELLEIIKTCLIATELRNYATCQEEPILGFCRPNEKELWYATAMKKMAWMKMSVHQALLEMQPQEYDTWRIDESCTISLCNSLLLSLFTLLEDKYKNDISESHIGYGENSLPSRKYAVTPASNLSDSWENINEICGQTNVTGNMVKASLPSGEVKYSCFCCQNGSGQIIFHHHEQ